jgi:hypothetical protein
MRNTARIRNSLVGGAVIALLVGLPFAFITSNPERRQQEKTLRELEVHLITERAIAGNLESYKDEGERVRARLSEVDRMLRPDFEALRQALAGDQAELVVGKAKVVGPNLHWPFHLRGASRADVPAVLSVLEGSGHLLRVSTFSVSQGQWTLRGYAFETRAQAEAQRATTPSDAGSGSPWYAPLNDDLRKEIEDKRAELRRLREAIGPAAAFLPLKEELEAKLALIQEMGGAPDLRGVMLTFLLADGAPFSELTLEADAETVVGRGRATRALDELDLRARVPEGLTLATFSGSDGGDVRFTLVSEPRSARAPSP